MGDEKRARVVEESPLSLSSTVTLPGTGDRMPVFGLGTWLSEPGKVCEATKVAIDAGYRAIDEAWVYFNEDEVGEALKAKIADGTVTRKDMFITSKLWNCFHRPDKVKEGLKESMAKLGVDYLDLFLIHFPVSFQPGVAEAKCKEEMDHVPLADTWAAMEKLVDEGLVRNIGVSNFEIESIKELQAVAKKPIAMCQFETQPYYQRRELVQYCAKHGIFVTAHTSLGSPNNVMKDHHPGVLMEDPVVRDIAKQLGRTPAQVLLRWALQRPTLVLPKSITPERIKSNAEVFAFTLGETDIARIDALDRPGLDGCFNHPKTPWLGRGEFAK